MTLRQIVFLLAAVLFLSGSVMPKAIIEEVTNVAFENQWLARLCLASIGIIMILTLHTVR